MQKAKSILAFGLLVVLLNSCVYSLFPIYTDDTLVYFPELLGRWEMEGGEDYIKFSNPPELNFFGDSSSSESTDLSKEKDYLVEIVDGGELIKFIGHIAEIGDDYFLDLYPYRGASASNMIPVHTFAKLKFSGKQLYLTSFDLEKLNKLFESNLIRLRHENVDGTRHYIHQNPVEAMIVDESEEYLFSSARDYAGRKGLVKVELY